MILSNFCAVNESSQDAKEWEGERGLKKGVSVQQEFEEERYVSLYNGALRSYGIGDYESAFRNFVDIFESEYFSRFGVKSSKPSPVAVKLQKCVSKYLGLLFEKRKEFRKSVEFLSESLKIDDSDVLLYFKIALCAVKITDLGLARSALEAGLAVSPDHWPSLELVIMVAYKTKDHFGCLEHIRKALSLDPSFAKALQLRDQIILENKYYNIDLGLTPSSSNAAFVPPLPHSLPLPCSTKTESPKRKLVLNTNSFSEILAGINEDYERTTRCHDYSLKLLYPLSLQEKSPPPLIRVSIQNLVNEIIDFVFVKKKTEGEIIAKSILFEEVLSEVPPYGSKEFVEDIIFDIMNDVVATGSDFLANLQATEIRRSSRARVSLVDRNDSDSAGNSRIASDDTARSHLESFVPPLLLNPKESEEPLSTEVTSAESGMNNRVSSFIGGKGSFEVCLKDDQEKEMASEFFTQVLFPYSNEGIVNILGRSLIYTLETLSVEYNWSNALIDQFIDTYLNWRRHFVYPDFYDSSSLLYFKIMILANEALLDREKRMREEDFSEEERNSELKKSFKRYYTYLKNDLEYMKTNSYELASEWRVRIISVEFEHTLIEENIVEAGRIKTRLRNLYESQVKPLKDIRLPFGSYSVYAPDSADKALESLKRNNLVEEIYNLYQTKKYKTVVSVLEESLSKDIEEKSYQVSIMIDSYWNLDDFPNCLKWSIIALCDFIEGKTSSNSNSLTNGTSRRGSFEDFAWTVDCYDLLKTMECCLLYTDFGSGITPQLRSRLVKSLIEILIIQIDYYSKQFVIKSVLPWIFVYRLIKHERKESHPEISFLVSAHDYLGQLTLCTEDQGKLLLLLLEDGFTNKSLNKKAAEQALFCLFSHPSKKSRVKHLTDHGVSQIALTFEKSLLVYENYFKPSVIPEFDDFKSNSISNDTEHFFKRMVALLPDDGSGINREEAMMKTITSGKKHSLNKKGKPLDEKLKDFYYLLADYYFKNSEFKPAISYYLLDLSYNESRIDSWIALSLALANRVEEAINDVFKPTNYKEIVLNSDDAMKCFHRCLSYRPKGPTIYIEFANFSYVMHSFSTRTLDSAPETLSMETFQSMEKIKEECLDLAERNYLEAIRIIEENLEDLSDDERWLLYLMLGKIKEKKKKPLSEALEIYVKALENLISQGASLSKKISYNAPQGLSLELLEIYFRIHASSLKCKEDLSKESQIQIKEILQKVQSKVQPGKISAEQVPPPEKKVKLQEVEKEEKEILRLHITRVCLQALETTVKYFNQHFKALYVLSNYYAKIHNFKKSRSYLLGSGSDSCSNKNSTGLFMDRKSNNLYNGIWRSPLTELDRAGSFPVHISKATSLLLDVLLATEDFQILAEVTAMLKRPPPDGERTYLADKDRITFARQAQTFYSRAVSAIVSKAKSKAQANPIDAVKTLLDLQQVYVKTRKTFREDSVRSMLVELLNSIGFRCKGYDEVAIFCQRLNAEKGMLEEYSKNLAMAMAATPVSTGSSSFAFTSTPEDKKLSSCNVTITPTKIPLTSKTTISSAPSSPVVTSSIIKTTVHSTSLFPTTKKYSCATAYKAKTALSSSVKTNPSYTSPQFQFTHKKAIITPKITQSSAGILIPKITKPSQSEYGTKNPFSVAPVGGGTPVLPKGVTIQRKALPHNNTKKLGKPKNLIGGSSVKSIIKPTDARSQLKNFKVNLHSVLKKNIGVRATNNKKLSNQQQSSSISKNSPCPPSSKPPVVENKKPPNSGLDIICID